MTEEERVEVTAEDAQIRRMLRHFVRALECAHVGRDIRIDYSSKTWDAVLYIDGQLFHTNVCGDNAGAVLFDIFRQHPDIFFMRK